MSVLFESNETAWQLLSRGKVRDIYDFGPNELLIVTTDRLSAFDVILPTPIPDKGVVLTQISNFWFGKTERHHPQPPRRPGAVRRRRRARPPRRALRGRAQGRSRCRSRRSCAATSPARAARTTSRPAWSAASRCRRASSRPAGCRSRCSRPRPRPRSATTTRTSRSTSSTTSSDPEIAERVRDAALELYQSGAAYALERGIIIADTKFEFGMLDGEVILIDEALTPDSSRFWPADGYEPGKSAAQLRQAVRARLPGDAGLGQDGARPGAAGGRGRAGPAEKYLEAWRRLTQA